MGEILRDPVVWQGCERILIVRAAVLFVRLGYKLFLFGAQEGQSKFATESKWLKVTFSGTGPGLLFMAVGGVILIGALFKSAASMQSDVPAGKLGSTEQRVPTSQVAVPTM